MQKSQRHQEPSYPVACVEWCMHVQKFSHLRTPRPNKHPKQCQSKTELHGGWPNASSAVCRLFLVFTGNKKSIIPNHADNALVSAKLLVVKETKLCLT